MTATRPAEIRRIADPCERVRAVNAAIEVHKQDIAILASITRDTVAELRAAGLSYAQVAAKLSVSRARAQQLASPKQKE